MDPLPLRCAVLLACAAAACAAAASTPAQPQPQPQDSEGSLPADILCGVYGSDLWSDAQRPGSGSGSGGDNCTAKARVRRQDQAAETLDQETICKIFRGPNCPPDQTKTYESCPCETAEGGCQCVPYYQCDNATGEFNQFGQGLLDIRQRLGDPCPHYLQQCCKIRSDAGVSPAPGPAPDPAPGPAPEPLPLQPNTRPPCGTRNRGGVGTRISGALDGETQFGEMTWMVAVFSTRSDGEDYVCGGALLAPTLVLTAAHCVSGKQPGILKIRAGEWDSQTQEEVYTHQDRAVDQVIVHPEFKPNSVHNDVALLVLAEPVMLGFHIGTICLPEQDRKFDHKRCIVSGWGKTSFGREGVYQVILKKIELPVVPHADCQSKLRRTRLGAYFKLHRSFLCAGGEKGKDACTGDGGSPLVCAMTEDEDARYELAGAVSWGVGCGEDDVPGVYADIASVRGWIDQQLATLSVDLSAYSS